MRRIQTSATYAENIAPAKAIFPSNITITRTVTPTNASVEWNGTEVIPYAGTGVVKSVNPDKAQDLEYNFASDLATTVKAAYVGVSIAVMFTKLGQKINMDILVGGSLDSTVEMLCDADTPLNTWIEFDGVVQASAGTLNIRMAHKAVTTNDNSALYLNAFMVHYRNKASMESFPAWRKPEAV